MFFKFALLALASVALAVPTARPGPIPVKICSSKACHDAAEYIRSAINETANPCENFYEYACGNWVAKHTIPPSRSRTGTFDVLNDQMDKYVVDELHAVNVSNPKQPQSIRLASYLFQKCLDVANEHDEVGWARIHELYLSVFTSDKNPTWDNLLPLTWVRASVSPIFAISIQQDPKNNAVNILNIDPAPLGLGDKELANPKENEKIIEAYKQYILSVGKVICKNKNLAKCNVEDLPADINAIVNLEIELAKIRLSPEDRRDPDLVYNKFSLDELKNKTGFDWQTFITNTLNLMKSTKKVDGNFKVLLSDVQYVVKAVEILKKTEPRVVMAYYAWEVISSFGSLSSEQFRKFKFQFEQVSLGVKELKSREKACHNFVYGSFDMALSRLFVSKHFTKQEKDAAAHMIDTIQASFNDIIKSNDWLDEVTRTKSIEKLAKVTKNVAYPEWIFNDSELDKFYYVNEEFFTELSQKKNFLISYLLFGASQTRNKVEEFDNKPNKDKTWPMPPAIINAAYEPVQNSITIPAGILKSPFFDSERPYSINYGFIGVVIGHEFTHGFDDQGSQFDLDGNQKDWWTETARKAYKKRAQCFVDEYGSIVDPITKLHLNGKNTLGENIADNGGLKEAFNAFKTREQKEGEMLTLAGLPEFDSDKLFFLSFAQTWCSITRPESMKNLILYNPHSPPKYRVEVPTYNNDAFHKAFNCPAKKTQEECKLW